MDCRNIMKKPVACCGEADTVQSAALMMRDRNIGFLPVIDGDGKVRGVLTDRDIAIRVCAEGLDPKTATVVTAMTRGPIACHPGDDLRRVEELMARFHKSRILVLDEAGRPAGVISLSDLARADQPYAGYTLREVASREVARRP